MRAVADASPLIFLARLGLLELLDELYEEILVPRAVMLEATAAGRPGASALIACQGLVGVEDPMRLEAEAVERHLGAGETSALLTAMAFEVDEILIDERRGRAEAKMLGLRARGTLGILARGKRQGLLLEVRPHLDRLASLGARVHPRLRQQILISLDED